MLLRFLDSINPVQGSEQYDIKIQLIDDDFRHRNSDTVSKNWLPLRLF